jgi:hypothetical protein
MFHLQKGHLLYKQQSWWDALQSVTIVGNNPMLCTMHAHQQTPYVPHPTKRGPWVLSGLFLQSNFNVQDRILSTAGDTLTHEVENKNRTVKICFGFSCIHAHKAKGVHAIKRLKQSYGSVWFWKPPTYKGTRSQVQQKKHYFLLMHKLKKKKQVFLQVDEWNCGVLRHLLTQIGVLYFRWS